MFNLQLEKIDKYGVVEKSKLVVLIVFSMIIMCIAATAGFAVWQLETGDPEANIQTYGEGVWTVWMSLSTIGFGDHYPISLGGMVVIGLMFVVGAVNLGVIVGLSNSFVTQYFDRSVQPRELKVLVMGLMVKMDNMEKQLKIAGLDLNYQFDTILESESIPHDDGVFKITVGKDDVGVYLIEVLDIQAGKDTERLYTGDIDRDDALATFRRIVKAKRKEMGA